MIHYPDYLPLFNMKELKEEDKKIYNLFMEKRFQDIEITFLIHNPHSKEQKLGKLSDYFTKIEK